MAENQDGQEKTEDASGKRVSDARGEGNVAKSMEVNTTVLFLFTIGIFLFYGGSLRGQLSDLMTHVFSHLHVIEIDFLYVKKQVLSATLMVLMMLGPILLTIMMGGIIASISQIGFLFAPKAMQPKISKLNPLKGLKNIMFSVRSLVELLKNILKLSIVGLVVYSVIIKRVDEFPQLIYWPVEQLFNYIMDIILEMALTVVGSYIIIAALDYWFQKHEHAKNLKMTKQEVKDEGKQLEGDPQIKGRIKSMQRQMAMNRMMGEIPDADVVITNPTHFAVALKYDSNAMDAPKVVAKGMDLIAQRIKKIAEENGVTIVENVELARALYKSCEVGDSVPEDLFQAVAEILAFVYRLKNRR